MAAKAKRAEKSVLSRQEIQSRKRQISDKKLQTHGAGRRAVIGVFVLAFSLLALLATATFDPHDRAGPGYHNAIGPAGHLMAEALRGTFGICAYVLPIAGLYAAMVIFVGRSRRRWPQVLSAAVLLVSTAVLAELVFGREPGWAHPPGGWVGQVLGQTLEGMFSTVGTVILVTAVSAAAAIIGTQFVFLKLCAAAWAALSTGGRRLQAAFAAFIEAQKAAAVARREAALKAKAEEAAFLAQLEADEEELAEQEREIAEAEAIAEEAERLSREALKAREAEALARQAAKSRAKEPADDRGAKRPESAPAVLPASERAEPAVVVPAGEPAWVSALLPPPPAEVEPKKARKTPNIVTAPSTPPAPAVATAPAPAPSVPPVPAAAMENPPPAPATAAPAAVSTPPTTALARTPVIVEPKAPPKPTRKKEQEQFQFVGDRKSFTLPPIDEVLEWNKKERTALDKEAFLSTAEKLRAKLADFGIVGEVVEIRPGPVVTMYEFLPGPGIKVSKIAALADDLAMAMEAMRVRIVAPIPGKGVVGIEVPNKDREIVVLKEIAEQDAFQKSASKLTMCLGKDIEGMPYVLDLAKAPHLLIAGTTGSGKSVAVNAMIMSILLKSTPEEVRFIMVDPKMLELSVYEGIPHLLLPVVTDPKKAALALRWAVEEMERRYALLAEAGVRNIAGYNKLVESATADVKEKLKKDASVVEGRIIAPAQTSAKQVEAPKPEPAPEAAPKKRKMMIIDVAAGETEEEAIQRASAAEKIGVAAPKDEPEDVREAVVAEKAPEPEVLSAAPEEIAPDVEEASSAAPAAATEPASEEDGKKQLRKLPYIVVIIDELADLMMVASREVETYIARLAQMARAAGIHLMVATQRPSTDVVTGVIKANFPTRISFMLRSKPDSMTILGTVGAESLLGMGDMLIMPPTSAHLQRVHGAYVSEAEISRVVEHLKAQGKPVYDESILKPRDEESEGGAEEDDLSDELYDQAVATVSEMKQVSISMLQRKMRIGYNRAARMIERMEREGIVGPADGARPREVLIRAVGEMPGAGAV
ncbi:MAG: DNA translocase FtsK 4TM domain-containing protein [Myxococcaceae bacterium]|nr:DNA translocase FtsK 4TM domain-containing protein [Myxococcaceae bacterium]